MSFAIPVFTDVFVPRPFTFRAKGKGALPVVFVILKFTDIFAPIGKGKGALPVVFAILKFTDVFSPIGKGLGALPVW